MNFKDYYDIKGVKRDASQDEVKRAYRKLRYRCRKIHTDLKDVGANQQQQPNLRRLDSPEGY